MKIKVTKKKLILFLCVLLVCLLLIPRKNIKEVFNYINKEINFISGERLQFYCNHFIGTDRDFNHNPNINKYKHKCLKLGDINSPFDNKHIIFCYTHLLDNINKLINMLKYMKNPFILIFHNSDGSFEKKHLILFNKLTLLKFIFTQNMNVVHSKIRPLPIGVANSQWNHGNLDIQKEVYHMNIEKTKNIYFNFNRNTNVLRNECYNIINQKKINWNTNKPYKEYLIELKEHKYCICPEGNGLDTHRFWECLYMNTIPICKRNVLVDYYSKFFPIIILDDWLQLDLDFLKREYYTFEIKHIYLDLDYIIGLIKNYNN